MITRLTVYTRWAVYFLIITIMGALYPTAARLWGGVSWRVASAAARFALRVLGVRVECSGETSLLSGGGRIIVANHRSWFDSLALAAVSPQRVRFLAKRGYFEMPIVGAMLRAYGNIPVHHDSSRPLKARSLRMLERALAQGESVVVYPEGTRSRGSELLPFRDGAWRIAAQTGHPMVAAYISGAESVWPKGARLGDLESGTIRIKVWKLTHAPLDAIAAARQGAEEEFRWLHLHDRHRPKTGLAS